jgi:hypothetical protein
MKENWRFGALDIAKTVNKLRALSFNTAKPVRTVKLLNETQNIWASDLSDWKILITLE